ncbi:MAG: NAD(P)/FAD-dependent oxidoreductase [Tissierellia bacterium]|nr:NAD(P)/FAD-dependent oxidoreductase [Tissierellia bacterium]MDD4780982.1 NAD(P)/FAD-dependent oxidoreductase [Tissierellia bacterium]
MKKHDIIIVGAGVGGSTAAYFMAKSGLNVLMVEKDQFPRDKPCGDGQVQSIHPLLKSMGVYDKIEKYGYKCPGTMISDMDENSCVFNYPEGDFAFCTPRYIFDDIINKAALKQGVDYIDNFEVIEVIMERGKAKGIRGIQNGKFVELESNIVVLANGAHSMLSRQMGFYEEDPEYVFYGLRGYFENVRGMQDVIEFHYPDEMFIPSGYIWIFPMSKTKANVGVFITEKSLQGTGMTSEELLWWWRDNKKIGKERLGEAVPIGNLKGWRLPSGNKQKVYGNGVIAVGDAGNMIESLYGGGLPHAMIAGVCAAKACAESIAANDYSEEFLKRYSDYVDKELGTGYKSSEMIRNMIFSSTKDIKDLVEFTNKNLKGVRCSGGDGMGRFLVQERGYKGPTKGVYNK